MNAAQNVLRRFLASRNLAAGSGAASPWNPPNEVVNGVESGELDARVLLMWKEVVRIQSEGGRNPEFNGVRAYWENKCLKNGIDLPDKYRKGIGGASAGKWSTVGMVQIEEWVKQKLYSEKLIDSVTDTVDDWEAEVIHLERVLSDSEESLTKAEAQLKKAKSPAGVKQALWRLNNAKEKLGHYGPRLVEAKEKIAQLRTAVLKHKEPDLPATIEFEKEFQFLLMLAAKSFEQGDVLKAAQDAIERFVKGAVIPAAGYAQSEEMMGRQEKYAGIIDDLGSWLKSTWDKAWNFVSQMMDRVVDWVASIGKATDRLENLLKEAGA